MTSFLAKFFHHLIENELKIWKNVHNSGKFFQYFDKNNKKYHPSKTAFFFSLFSGRISWKNLSEVANTLLEINQKMPPNVAKMVSMFWQITIGNEAEGGEKFLIENNTELSIFPYFHKDNKKYHQRQWNFSLSWQKAMGNAEERETKSFSLCW